MRGPTSPNTLPAAAGEPLEDSEQARLADHLDRDRDRPVSMIDARQGGRRADARRPAVWLLGRWRFDR
jgi:hypothetical protein